MNAIIITISYSRGSLCFVPNETACYEDNEIKVFGFYFVCKARDDLHTQPVAKLERPN